MFFHPFSVFLSINSELLLKGFRFKIKVGVTNSRKMLSNVLFRFQNIATSITNRGGLPSKALIGTYHNDSVSSKNSKVTDSCNGLISILRGKFPLARDIKVRDVSGGCGAMYDIVVESIEFKGLPKPEQHRLVHNALSEEIRAMHGVCIQTLVPKS